MDKQKKYCKELISEFTPIKKEFIDLNLILRNGQLISVSKFAESYKESRKVIILGNAGSGKTVITNYLANYFASKYLKDKSTLPIKIRAHELTRSNTVKNIISSYLLESGNLEYVILIDGLDEILPNDKKDIFKEIENLQFENSSIVLTSRPSYISNDFKEFEKLMIQELNSAQISSYLNNRLGKKYSSEFINSLDQNSQQSLLTGNPLYLSLLFKYFLSYGKTPKTESLYEIFENYSNYVLSTWDYQKDIGSRSLYTLGDVKLFLELIAFQLYKNHSLYLDFSSFYSEISSNFNLRINEYTELIQYFINRNIITQRDDRISFVHQSLYEYYLLSYSIEKKSLFSSILDTNPELINNFGNTESIINELLNQRKFELAYKVTVKSKLKNKSIILNLFDQLFQTDNVENPILSSQSSTKNPLIELWESFRNLELNSFEKGRKFELFIIELFKKQFDISHHNLNTHNGEIDIVLEQKITEPFWSEYGGTIIVECKNWNTNVPLKDIGTFNTKVINSRTKLGFFISVSGFTVDAYRLAENLANNIQNPLIIPISGEDIEELLNKKLDLNKFLKNQINRIRFNRKY